jgi:hypothetical protein
MTVAGHGPAEVPAPDKIVWMENCHREDKIIPSRSDVQNYFDLFVSCQNPAVREHWPRMTKREEKVQFLCQTQTLEVVAKRFRTSRQRIYQIIHPDRHAARIAVAKALRHGRLVRPDKCQKCPSLGPLEAHHPDYSRPLDVEWLCRPCHNITRRTSKKQAERRNRKAIPLSESLLSQAMSALARRPRTVTPALRKANQDRSRAYWKTHHKPKTRPTT